MIRTLLAPLALAAAVALTPAEAPAEEAGSSWLPTLMTETPEQGFALAVRMARTAVKTTQPDVETLHKLRPAYAHDPQSLIAVSGTAAAWFATIAEANGYWRE
jgi:hypothetical protein